MADEQADSQAGTQAVPEAASVIRTPSTAAQTKPAPAPADDSPEGRVAKAKAALVEAEAALPKQQGTTRVRVDAPHAEFHFGGVVIGEDFTAVNDLQLSSILQAAQRSGVTLITE